MTKNIYPTNAIQIIHIYIVTIFATNIVTIRPERGASI